MAADGSDKTASHDKTARGSDKAAKGCGKASQDMAGGPDKAADGSDKTTSQDSNVNITSMSFYLDWYHENNKKYLMSIYLDWYEQKLPPSYIFV